MAKDKRPEIRVITNEKLKDIAPPDVGKKEQSYHTNPLYKKLLQYREEQKHKRFSVEDLLKW